MSEHIARLRAVVAETPRAPEAMAAYLVKVRERAFTITDADIGELKDLGLSEDEIFEQTVGVAVAEGLRRLDAAQAVIG